MTKYNVTLEVFRPERKLITQFIVDDTVYTTLERLTDIVNKRIVNTIPKVLTECPEATEIRWQYDEYGQGHYIMIDEKHRKMMELKKVALECYEEGGDYMTECWNVAYWIEFIDDHSESEDIVGELKALMKLLNDRREDVQSEAF